MIPVTVVAGGAGPTALITGGNHGDEYEGPIAIMDLARRLRVEEVAGRVILIPQMNAPAFRAGRRTSPLDGGNLNRAFPGRPDGSATEKIADYFTRQLLPMADFVLDFHSGGRTLDFLPFAAAHVLEDKAQEEACMDAMRAFNAPFSMRLLEIDAGGMYDSEAEAQGKVFVTTELGGGGAARAEMVAVARKGLRNFLIHAGILDGEPEIAPSVMLDMPDADCFTFAETAGVFEPAVDLGARVRAGEVLARVWPVEATGREPVEYRARREGIFAARHWPGLVGQGDCLAVVAEVVEELS
jgi:N-alpha-acetyl-L-2,4-diaminobutyrate deacetylase